MKYISNKYRQNQFYRGFLSEKKDILGNWDYIFVYELEQGKLLNLFVVIFQFSIFKEIVSIGSCQDHNRIFWIHRFHVYTGLCEKNLANFIEGLELYDFQFVNNNNNK